MHKETVNTFTKGMIKDTHPLTTPADVLTDCLNGTIITYNGNEMILLNDMGNVLIGTSTLPEGYIPIGVTEYGGIVYIASYNPTTGKGLIGSFPSPQLQHMSEMWSVNISELTPTTSELDLGVKFYDETNVNDIVRTEYKYYLGRNGEGKDVYILHTGDKIKITNNGLAALQSLSCILLLFAILKKDGSIELVDGNYLDGEEHIYTGKSSGYPLIIIKMLTLKSFNLERKYSRGEKVNNNDTVNVTFTGKPLKEDSETTVTLLTKTTTTSELPKDYTEETLSFEVKNLSMEGSLKYEIIPKLDPQGNLVSMTKEGTIDLSKFKSDKAELKNWSYIIMDTYMKINWSFDYYNLDDDKEIRKVTFNFIQIDLPINSGIPIDLEKDSFNGSFEEIVNFEEGITKNNIYIVKIVGYKGADINNIDTDNPVHLGSRMVYTSGILNQYYGKVKDFTNTGFMNDYPSVMWNYKESENPLADQMALKKTIEVKITPTINVATTTTGNNIKVVDPKNNSINTNLREINAKTFTTKTTDIGNGYYNIDVTNKYKFEVGLKAEVKYDNQIVGSVADATIKTMLNSFVGNKLIFTDESQLIGTLRLNNEFTSTLAAYNTASTYESGEEGYTGTLKFDEDLILTSKMKVKATGVKTKVVERRGLRPLYYPSMDKATKDKCFTAWNKDYPLFCAGADENDYHYNVTLAGGSNSGGTSTGAGCDDTGLNTAMTLMGYPMVSMAAGMDGDEASYSPDETSADSAVRASEVSYYRRRPVAGWSCSANEIDGGDNFLMAVWKQTDNNYRFSILGSLKAYLNNRNGRLVRLDYMLRCLLSQIFTKQAYKETLSYVTTNASEYAYYNTQVKVDIDLKSNPSIDYNNVKYKDSLFTNYDILFGEDTIEKLLNSFIENHVITNNEVMIIKYDYQKTILEADTTFATDFGINDISTMFSGATYEASGDENDDKSNERWIYTVDWTAVDRYGQNKVYEFLSDDSINWKLDDLTPFLKLSGTKDGSGYAFVDDDGSYKVKKSDDTILSIDVDPLSLSTGSPSHILTNVVTVYNNSDYNKGGLTVSSHCYGDVLRTWNNKEWPFYHSFQHVFKTYCQWKDENISSEIYNEIVINRDSGHIGEQNIRAMWRNNKDENAPDMVGALGNSYNSIYAAATLDGLAFSPLENANYTV